MALRRLGKEIQKLQTDKSLPSNVAWEIGENLLKWNIWVQGGAGYGNRWFCIEVAACADYPSKAPVAHFKTPIVHPNVERGSVCLSTLGRGWSPALTMRVLGICLQQLVENPNFEDPLDEEAAEYYRNNGKAAYGKYVTAQAEKYGATPEPDLTLEKKFWSGPAEATTGPA